MSDHRPAKKFDVASFIDLVVIPTIIIAAIGYWIGRLESMTADLRARVERIELRFPPASHQSDQGGATQCKR